MGNLTPLPILSEIKVGKMACFGFCAASFFIWGDGGLLFHFIFVQDCRPASVKRI